MPNAEGFMSDSLKPTTPDPAAGGALHNSVLMRSHEPPRSASHTWIMFGALGVAIVAGVAFWAFAATHPAGPIENHAVAASTQTYTVAQKGG